jgi:hypothetical protein
MDLSYVGVEGAVGCALPPHCTPELINLGSIDAVVCCVSFRLEHDSS